MANKLTLEAEKVLKKAKLVEVEATVKTAGRTRNFKTFGLQRGEQIEPLALYWPRPIDLGPVVVTADREDVAVKNGTEKQQDRTDLRKLCVNDTVTDSLILATEMRLRGKSEREISKRLLILER